MRAKPVKGEVVLEVGEAALRAEGLFQRFNGATLLQPFNAAAALADEVVVMLAGQVNVVVGSAVVQANAAHQGVLLQFDEQAVDRGAIGQCGQAGVGAQIRKGEWLTGFKEQGQHLVQGGGAAQSGGLGPLQALLEKLRGVATLAAFVVVMVMTAHAQG